MCLQSDHKTYTLSLTYEADEIAQSHSHSFLGIWAFDSQDGVLSICFLEQESIPLLKKSWNPHLHRDLSVSPQRYVNSKQKSTWKTPPFRLEEREFSSKINKRSQYITFFKYFSKLMWKTLWSKWKREQKSCLNGLNEVEESLIIKSWLNKISQKCSVSRALSS